ncbi:hypothetical protein ACFV6D_26060 [Kitasatospora sp. NPDC059812]|uniref:hypothetical protein n=1 Tax=Kitasatospora sp. NPDC059812 TaxID=3346958 RepID=UPI00364904BE
MLRTPLAKAAAVAALALAAVLPIAGQASANTIWDGPTPAPAATTANTIWDAPAPVTTPAPVTVTPANTIWD